MGIRSILSAWWLSSPALWNICETWWTSSIKGWFDINPIEMGKCQIYGNQTTNQLLNPGYYCTTIWCPYNQINRLVWLKWPQIKHIRFPKNRVASHIWALNINDPRSNLRFTGLIDDHYVFVDCPPCLLVKYTISCLIEPEFWVLPMESLTVVQPPCL